MRSVSQKVWIVALAVLCAAVSSRSAVAEDATSFVEPTGWSVGDANSTYQEWDVFSGRSGNVPDIGHYPASFATTLSAASPAIKTGTGNLYSFSGNYNWWAGIENYGGNGTGTKVLVQVAASLHEDVGVLPTSLAIVQPDGSSLLGGDNASVLNTVTLFEGLVYSPATDSYATTQEQLWEFFLPDYTDDFRVVGTNSVHSSLMQVRVDSMIVPEPAAIVLVGMGLIALGAYRIVRRGRRRPCNA